MSIQNLSHSPSSPHHTPSSPLVPPALTITTSVINSTDSAQHVDDANHPSNKKKRRAHLSISHAQKRRLCELNREYPKARHGELAKLFLDETGRRVERSTVTRVLQRKDLWLRAGKKEANRRRLASPRYPLVEEAMWEMIRHRAIVRALRSKLDDRELVRVSKQVATELVNMGCAKTGHVNYIHNLDSFKGSLSWVTSFKRRNCIGIEGDEDKKAISPSYAMDIWTTEWNTEETKKLLSNWTRSEDLYFLEATVLATAVLPDQVVEESFSSSSIASHIDEAAIDIDEALGLLISMHHQDSSGGGLDMGGVGFPTNNFAPLTSNTSPSGASHAFSASAHASADVLSNGRNRGGGRGKGKETGKNSGRVSSKSNVASDYSSNSRVVDDDSVVVVLLCANGNGDRQTPWLVGKPPLRKIGAEEGQVWHDSKVRYFHNVRGWLTSRIVRKWIEEFDESLDRSVALLTSLLTGPDLEQLRLKNVTLIPVPRTDRLHEYGNAFLSRSKLSPLNSDIEEHFRAKYRYMVVDRAMEYISHGSNVKKLSLKSAAKMIEMSWSKIPTAVIRKAWRDPAYMPSRLVRSSNQPRSNARALIDQRLSELAQVVQRYGNALRTFSEERDALRICSQERNAHVQVALNNLKQYIWWSSEGAVFHPQGSLKDFVQSVCTTQIPEEDSSNEEDMEGADWNQFPRIHNYEVALRVANKLAEFMRKDDALSKHESLYFIGSLQMEIKKLCDEARDEEQERAWRSTSARNS